ncbi:hypothetical protein [Neobacillus cucumis]|uniref:hypothetical protein n=1 Tax=Neobacillus cucumis TaxID=1740721 RepID=UPI001963618B|nr:hypothetical protein [Neobacillus cucumis]MBM7655438.1 uncharacterized membrane protein YhaH (DUF805 family) [Neobacillus cucumis]MED4228424.1 hypothetical protein [Neobacillus cucumis]
MKKVHFFIWLLMIIATIFGIYGQSLAYFVDEHMANTNPPIYFLTIFTVISVCLYLVILLFAYLMIKVKKFDNKFNIIYIYGFGMIGFCVSLWSVFVCAMWWG